MQLSVERTGGFAGGFAELGPVQTDSLEPTAAEQIVNLLNDIEFFDIPGNVAGHQIRDDFQLQLRVIDGERRHAVIWDRSADDKYRAELDRVVELLQSTGADFIDWRFEGEPLDWDDTSVAIPFNPDGPYMLSVSGTATHPVTVRLAPEAVDETENYRPVHVLGQPASDPAKDTPSPWEITTSFDWIANERGWFVLIGATKREYFPPQDVAQ